MMIQTTHAHSRESRAPLAHLSFLLMSPSTSFRFALLAAASSPLCIASGTPPCAASLAASVSFRLLSIAVSIWRGARANGRADGARDDDETRWKDRKRPTARARGGRKCQCFPGTHLVLLLVVRHALLLLHVELPCSSSSAHRRRDHPFRQRLTDTKGPRHEFESSSSERVHTFLRESAFHVRPLLAHASAHRLLLRSRRGPLLPLLALQAAVLRHRFETERRPIAPDGARRAATTTRTRRGVPIDPRPARSTRAVAKRTPSPGPTRPPPPSDAAPPAGVEGS